MSHEDVLLIVAAIDHLSACVGVAGEAVALPIRMIVYMILAATVIRIISDRGK